MANRGKGEGPFEILARIAPIGLFRTDAAGDCVYVNDRWTEPPHQEKKVTSADLDSEIPF